MGVKRRYFVGGASALADLNDATRRAITVRIPGSSKNVALRGMKFFNGSIIAHSPAQDGLGFVCLTNQSWIYSWKIMNLDVEQSRVMDCSSADASPKASATP